MNGEIPKIAKDVIWRYEGNKTTIIQVYVHRIVRLGETESYVWKLINGANTIGDINNYTTRRYDLDGKNVRINVEKLLSKLKQYGMIEYNKTISSLPTEESLINSKRGKILFESPLYVDLMITWECNLRCKHCLFDAGNKSLNELTLSEIKNLIDELAELNVFMLGLNGGEPTIRKDFMDIVRYADSKGLSMNITTNGTLINSQMANELKKHDIACVRVSLDGSNPNTHDTFRGVPNTFNNALKSIRLLVKSNIPVTILMTVSKFNLHEIDDVVRLAQDLGVRAFNAIPLLPGGRADKLKHLFLSVQEYREFLKKMKKIKEEMQKKGSEFVILTESPLSCTLEQPISSYDRICPAGVISCTIDPEGNIFPCSYFPLKVGSIRNEKLIEIWRNSPVFQKLRDVSYLKGKCKNCEYKYLCRGGCRALSYIKYEDFTLPDPICWHNP